MNIKFSSGALKFLKKNQAASILIRLVELEGPAGDIDMVKDVEIKFRPPEDRSEYLLFQQGGFDVFIDRRLKIPGDIKIKKQGFWKFSFLYPDGILVPF
ncbi:MAG: hypothetical protein R6V41_11015 [Desulfobacteraceae bacterium]